MKFFLSFVLLLSITIISCNSTSGGKKNKETLTLSADTSSGANAVRYQLITDALKSPVQLVAPPDHSNRLFICDLSGKIFILKAGKVVPAPFIDISSKLEQKDTAPNVRAAFSIAFHPDFARNKKFYVCYNAPATNPKDKCKFRISEFTVSGTKADVADLSSERPVFEMESKDVGDDECEMAFGPDGYLYIAIGALASPADTKQAQNLNSLLGKVLRIDVNKTPYKIPADNPFVGSKNAKPEIWAYGLRRLWRFSFDTETHQLFGADVGDKKQEEVDVIQKGGNYGWPVMEGDSLLIKNAKVDTSTFIAPLNTYTHKDGICVIGGSVYHGTALPFLKNTYVFADYKARVFSLVKNADGKWTRLPVNVLNPPADPLMIFSLDKDQDNELYVLGVLNGHAGFKGVVYKLVHS